VKKVFLLAVLALVGVTGCKSGSSGSSGGTTQSINGAGSTFINPILSKWANEYHRQNPGIAINYQSIGSGGGIRQTSEGTVDFGATDGPMTDAQLNASKIKLIHIPAVLGADVPTYNLPGVTQELKFSPDVLAGIYLGKITMWNDPLIARDNPGVNLPSHTILPVYRSDGSGTTYIWTDYLSKISPEWNAKIGRGTAVKWPAGVGQKGNEGVAELVRQSPYTIGYVELGYAVQNNMQYGLVRNKSGNFVKASTQSVTAAAAAYADSIPADYRVSITDGPGADSYPISSFSWLLIPNPAKDPAKGKAIVGFLNWMLDKGEAEAPSLSYAPLPAAVAERVRKTIATLN